MPTVDIDDTAIYYERTGTGPAMLFIHGMCGDAEAWAGQARRLENRFTCVRYDRRGHTRSTRGSRRLSPSRHADDAAELIASLELAPCLVVASSAGAVIAVDLARRHGRSLAGLVISEPPLFSLDRAAGEVFRDGLQPLVDSALGSGGPAAAVDAFFSHVCPTFWAGADDRVKARYRANADVGLDDLRSPPLEVGITDLASMSLPVLVVAGTTSHPVFGAVARQLVEAWPGARLVELEGSGHVTYAERPERFAYEVAAFADGLADGAPATAPASSPGLC